MQPRAQQRLQHFQHDQRDEACTERQGEKNFSARTSGTGMPAHDTPCLHPQARRFGFEGGQRLADLADLALRADGGYFRQLRAPPTSAAASASVRSESGFIGQRYDTDVTR